MSIINDSSLRVSKNWIVTWHSPSQPVWDKDFPFPTKIPKNFKNKTIRQTARISLGGDKIRIKLSNQYGTTPINVGTASISKSNGDESIIAASTKPITFNQQSSFVIPAGETIVSDDIPITLNSLDIVAVDLYFPDSTIPETFHWETRQNAYITENNLTSVEKIKTKNIIDAGVFLNSILVHCTSHQGTITTFGDSITGGTGAMIDKYSRYPDFLANRLINCDISVISAGIAGNRLLKDGMGIAALDRFKYDALQFQNVETIILQIGINDIGMPGTIFAPNDTLPSVEAMIESYQQLIQMARDENIRIIGMTLPPFEDALSSIGVTHFYSKEKDDIRREMNHWIRNESQFDGLIDLEAILKDPHRPNSLLNTYDSGDRLHPNDIGNKQIADSIDISTIIY